MPSNRCVTARNVSVNTAPSVEPTRCRPSQLSSSSAVSNAERISSINLDTEGSATNGLRLGRGSVRQNAGTCCDKWQRCTRVSPRTLQIEGLPGFGRPSVQVSAGSETRAERERCPKRQTRNRFYSTNVIERVFAACLRANRMAANRYKGHVSGSYKPGRSEGVAWSSNSRAAITKACFAMSRSFMNVGAACVNGRDGIIYSRWSIARRLLRS